ncbi:ANTH-domain-containing protein [Rickenella mellea]|uniref:ANTH-domain-containing protein n=1 Tax=Rickenella mellea TaxID=50990 RepID=A0A4Y7QAZ3_9AGAM|nr:ANTH-domain-containing protein [Rickenella mellea]
MSSFDKTVKLACKPKAAPPKAKYLDPIIAATYSEDGAIHDVCKALSPRFREPNAIIVFKALIVLHTMMRNGATDNILSYLSSSDVLRLKNVSTGQWEGYSAPQNLQNYSAYLDMRIRTYKDLKHDPVRVQSEVNRDLRVDTSIEEDRQRARGGGSSGPQRSKTIAGRKLRVMTVEKGLLRETKAVQKMITALLECRFYLDDLEDELNITALRMLVKDLLVLFQAVNEGVINVLEHYFEMSHVDAESALALYRHFCKQTERVVEYLGIAKKLQNLLNVSIPNLKHAPVSLVGSLEEYLNDPNFEQNRLEYKANKAAADGNTAELSKPSTKSILKSNSAPASSSSSPPPVPSLPGSMPKAKGETNQALVDFFSAIEEEQPNMFNPQTGSPTATYFQQQAAHNPFAARQSMMATGASPFPQGPFGAQPTGFPQLQAQNTAFPMNGFPQQQQQTGFPNAFLQPQQPAGFLQPQGTGAPNPFRQSMLMPSMTGFPSSFASFGASAQNGGNAGNAGINSAPTGNPFPSFQVQQPIAQMPTQPQSAQGSAFGSGPGSMLPKPFGGSPFASLSGPGQQQAQPGQQQVGQQQQQPSVPARPASTPITGNLGSNSPFGGGGTGAGMKAVASHQTGSRNPFGIPQAAPPPPVPKQPTLLELKTGIFGGGMGNGIGGQLQQQSLAPQQQQQQQGSANAGGGSLPGSGFSVSSMSGGQAGGPSSPSDSAAMSSIASSFTFNSDWKPNGIGSSAAGLPTSAASSITGQTNTTSSNMSDSFTSFSSQQTGSTNTTMNTMNTGATSPLGGSSIGSLQPQATGFGGIKPFKPTSSFGATLLESLPPIPQSAANTGTPGATSPAGGVNNTNMANGITANGTTSNNTTSFSSTLNPPIGALNAQPTSLGAFGASGGAFGSSSLGAGLRPQATGGVANPFRASMLNPGFTGVGGSGAFSSPGTAFGGGSSLFPGATTGSAGAPSSFGSHLFPGSGAVGGAFGNNLNDPTKTQQQNGVASLI